MRRKVADLVARLQEGEFFVRQLNLVFIHDLRAAIARGSCAVSDGLKVWSVVRHTSRKLCPSLKRLDYLCASHLGSVWAEPKNSLSTIERVAHVSADNIRVWCAVVVEFAKTTRTKEPEQADGVDMV